MELSNEALEIKREYNRVWRESHKEELRLYYKLWRESHKDQVRENNRRYWENKAKQQNKTDKVEGAN
jgi:hypothetical protein